MNPYRVLSKEEVEETLTKRGFTKTGTRTATGTFWRSGQTGKHVQVPDPYEGMYPRFLLSDLNEQLERMGQPQLH